MTYRGRIAPTPTGLLHEGHGRTFWLAAERARQENGRLICRIEDIDRARCRQEFVDAAIEDLTWLGIRWDEGPGAAGDHTPYFQSERTARYRRLLQMLHDRELIFPCRRSRRDLEEAAIAPHSENEEPVYPAEWRPLPGMHPPPLSEPDVNWRFRVPLGEEILFTDERIGRRGFKAGWDFGDFVVWRRDNCPAYQLTVVADDAEMEITEVVRGEDLLMSTARQILLYHALDFTPPQWLHAPLVLDENGERLAKRHGSRSLRALRESGVAPEELIERWRRELEV